MLIGKLKNILDIDFKNNLKWDYLVKKKYKKKKKIYNYKEIL